MTTNTPARIPPPPVPPSPQAGHDWKSRLVTLGFGLVPVLGIGFFLYGVWQERVVWEGWAWMLGLFPAFMIAQQMTYVYFVKARRLIAPPTDSGPGGAVVSSRPPPPPPPGGTSPTRPVQVRELPLYERVRVEAISDRRQVFSFKAIFNQLGFPALLCVLSGLMLTFVIVRGHEPLLARLAVDPVAAVVGGTAAVSPTAVGTGVVFGGLGAFVYVLLHLSQRSFLRDITSGSATWCAIIMVLGPVMGGITAVLFRLSGSGTDLAGTEKAVAFFAGAFPRYMVAVISEVVRRLFQKTSTTTNTIPRLIPLTTLRGVTADIEERLLEEGIADVNALAMANPYRLIRNTPYHERLILAWIDESLLQYFVPQQWQALENVGVSGAIDLSMTFEENAGDYAKEAHMAEPVFKALVNRLRYDSQVTLITLLYETLGQEEGET